MLSPSKLTKVLNISYLQVLNISYLRRYSLLNKLIILQYIIIWYSAYSRICTVQKIFDCKKCHTHLVSFIRHHGLFVPYIDTFEGTKVGTFEGIIFDCKKCHTHLLSFIKHHGLFVPWFIFILSDMGEPTIICDIMILGTNRTWSLNWLTITGQCFIFRQRTRKISYICRIYQISFERTKRR